MGNILLNFIKPKKNQNNKNNYYNDWWNYYCDVNNYDLKNYDHLEKISNKKRLSPAQQLDSREAGLEIFNKLPFDIQYYMQKIEKDELNKRLLIAKKVLEETFIRYRCGADVLFTDGGFDLDLDDINSTFCHNFNLDSTFYHTKGGSGKLVFIANNDGILDIGVNERVGTTKSILHWRPSVMTIYNKGFYKQKKLVFFDYL